MTFASCHQNAAVTGCLAALGAGQPSVAFQLQPPLAFTVAHDHTVGHVSALLDLPESHEGEAAFLAFHFDAVVEGGGNLVRENGIEPILVIDASPAGDAPFAVAAFKEVIKPPVAET